MNHTNSDSRSISRTPIPLLQDNDIYFSFVGWRNIVDRILSVSTSAFSCWYSINPNVSTDDISIYSDGKPIMDHTNQSTFASARTTSQPNLPLSHLHLKCFFRFILSTIWLATSMPVMKDGALLTANIISWWGWNTNTDHTHIPKQLRDSYPPLFPFHMKVNTQMDTRSFPWCMMQRSYQVDHWQTSGVSALGLCSLTGHQHLSWLEDISLFT
jgi:hypothetical protein